MPIYEYWCSSCRRSYDFFVRNVDAHSVPACPKCKDPTMERLISKVSTTRSEEAKLENLADPANLAGLDEENPRAMAKWLRKMSRETGEDMGQEFNEMCSRLEAGEDPEEIEKSMGDMGLGGQDELYDG